MIDLDKQKRIQLARNHLNIAANAWRKTIFINDIVIFVTRG